MAITLRWRHGRDPRPGTSGSRPGGDRRRRPLRHRSPTELAAAFAPGDRLIALGDTGDLLHVPAAAARRSPPRRRRRASTAFEALGAVGDEQISSFFDGFAARLADDDVDGAVLAANERRRRGGRAVAGGRRPGSCSPIACAATMVGRPDAAGGTRRCGATPGSARSNTTAGASRPAGPRSASSAFVFEGRPNVFADAAGVVRTGNTVVMRIGVDALGTAEAIIERCVAPALAAAGLPAGTIEPGPLAGAGGRLGPVRPAATSPSPWPAARVRRWPSSAPSPASAGTPVSLHGTGGAWLVAGRHADADRFAVERRPARSTARCATRSTCAASRRHASTSSPVFLDAVDRAAAGRETSARLARRSSGSRDTCRRNASTSTVTIARADGDHVEPAASPHRRQRPGDRVGVGGVARGVAGGRRRRRRRRRRCPTATALGSSPRSSPTSRPSTTVLRRRRRPVRRRRVHPLGRRPVRPRHARARPVELAGRPPAGPRRRPVGRLGVHRPPPRHDHRPRPLHR